MNFTREGLAYIAIAAGLSALGFVAAVSRRSWSLWLLAILLLVATLVVAYRFRDPERLGGRPPVAGANAPSDPRARGSRTSIDTNAPIVHVNQLAVGAGSRA